MKFREGKMAKWHAVSIGVKKAGQLKELPGAVNGAKDFAKWARGKGYNTKLITDEKRPVTLIAILSAITKIVDKDFPERLLIYFGGHGVQQMTTTPVWLLSGWEQNRGEAVNVNLTMFMASRSGIPRVGIFADACRNVLGEAATLSPQSIFPPNDQIKNPSTRRTQCDRFFSCRFDEISQEVNAVGAIAAYGVFTQCLINALKGKEPEAIELDPTPELRKAVTSEKLADFLDDAVPLESGKMKRGEVQIPDIESLWRKPDVVYNPGPFEKKRAPLPARQVAAQKAVTAARQKAEAQLEVLTREIDEIEGRGHFETLRGLTIVGDIPIEAVVSRAGRLQSNDIFLENDSFHIRGPGVDAPRSIAIRLESGNWLATALLPGFIGAILVKDSVAASVSYEPVPGSRFYNNIDDRYGAEIGRWTALMHQGRFASRDELRSSALTLRQYKHTNPSLGILAAYAYDRAGDTDEIESIAGYFADYSQPVPFDVAMLSAGSIRKNATGELEIETVLPAELTGNKGHKQIAPVGGSFPLLTRGWSLLDLETEVISPRLLDLRKYLVRSLWTTFSPEGGSEIAYMLMTGEL